MRHTSDDGVVSTGGSGGDIFDDVTVVAVKEGGGGTGEPLSWVMRSGVRSGGGGGRGSAMEV